MQSGALSSDCIGPYRIIKHLSVTGSVQVHLAREDRPGGFSRNVVLKMVPKVSGEGAQEIEELTREATACAKLTHPSIARIRHFFEHDGLLVLVAEHVDGIPLAVVLADQVAQGKRLLSDDAAFHIGVSICDALAHAHASDSEPGARDPIIHRALNPANVLLARDGTVKLDGFGFAKILGGVGTDVTGSFKWTPAYLAPEQVSELPATPKIDVYAAGLILWELLVGRPPTVFPQDPFAIEATLRAVAKRNPPSLATVRPDLPQALAFAVDAALVSAPDKRTIGCADIARWLLQGRLDAGKRELRELVIRTQAAASTGRTKRAPMAHERTLAGVAPPPQVDTPAPGDTLAPGDTQDTPTIPLLPVGPPRPPLPPPERRARRVSEALLPPPDSERHELAFANTVALTSPLPLPPLVPTRTDPPPDRPSLVNVLRAPTPWRRSPTLVAWAGLTLGLVGVIAKVAFFNPSSATVSAAPIVLQATTLEPAPTPPAPPSPALAPENEPPAVPTASPATSPEPSAAEEVSEDLKQRGLGYLTVHSLSPNANVYVNLKLRGKVEERLTVPCGNRFVSIGVPYGRTGEPSWLAPGKMMLVPCGGPLETTMDPRALRTR